MTSETRDTRYRMSAKTDFFKKLQAQQASTRETNSKGEADIEAFRRGLGALQENVVAWLSGTGIQVSEESCALTEMLISNAAFTVPCFTLHYEHRTVKFTPLFLYGQGVTGCVEVTLAAGGRAASVPVVYAISGKPCLDVHPGRHAGRTAGSVRRRRLFQDDRKSAAMTGGMFF